MARIGSTVRRAVDKVGRVVGIFDKSLDSFTLDVEVRSRGDHCSRPCSAWGPMLSLSSSDRQKLNRASLEE